jgi:uncharacterized damage-inducible protein DinB
MVTDQANISIIEDLFRFNKWANSKVIELANELNDAQLDERRSLGFGSLRETFFHILAAEEIWLERWLGLPHKPFPLVSEGLSISDLHSRLMSVDERRSTYLSQIGPTGLTRICHYQDSKGNGWSNPLIDLMLHLVNHGIHHRAQALHFLKRANLQIKGGLDYLFYRLAYPNTKQSVETAQLLASYGLEINSGVSPPLHWDSELIERYFSYGDWANAKLFPMLADLTDHQLDFDFGMGVGSIRKTALHIYDAERFWYGNWVSGSNQWENSSTAVSVPELKESWSELMQARNQFLSNLNERVVGEPVNASFGGPPIRIPIVESMVQLCGHGTHHRAQLLNMLRNSGVSPVALDYVVFVRQPLD